MLVSPRFTTLLDVNYQCPHRTEADAEKRDAIILMHLHRIAEHMEALMQNQEALARHVESIGSLLSNLGSRLATIEQEVRKIHK